MLPRIPLVDLLRFELLVARLDGLGEIPGNRGSFCRLSIIKLRITAQIVDGRLLGTEWGSLTFGLLLPLPFGFFLLTFGLFLLMSHLSSLPSLRFLSSLPPLLFRRHNGDV